MDEKLESIVARILRAHIGRVETYATLQARAGLNTLAAKADEIGTEVAVALAKTVDTAHRARSEVRRLLDDDTFAMALVLLVGTTAPGFKVDAAAAVQTMLEPVKREYLVAFAEALTKDFEGRLAEFFPTTYPQDLV